MSIQFICAECGGKHAPENLLWRCPCGGLLNVDEYTISFPMDEIKKRSATMGRYLEALPFQDPSVFEQVTLGEGYTPMVPLDSNSPNIMMKMDYMMPTLSFKDRGAAVLIAKAKELGVTNIIADSSGNAGTSIAAYASRAGISCDIYVPASTSPKKLKQIKAHGANLHEIPGSREDTAAAIEAVEKKQVFYASHVYNPYFYQGTKTYAFEIWEQLNGEVPDTIVIPVGNGTLLLGAYYGFRELLKCGNISKIPRFVAVQAEGCAPLVQAFERGEKDAEPVVNSGTAAEGIAIAAPARHRQILQAIRETNGIIITAPEGKIEQAREELAKKGFYVEPTTAATYAGFQKYRSQYKQGNPDHGDEKIVIPLCGAGIKAN